MSGIQEYKCPCCGGAITFDSSLQKMKCPYCDTEFDVEALKGYDEDLNFATDEDKIEWENPGKVWQEADVEGMRVYVCKSCGGQIIGDENLGATNCPFCGNPVVLMGQFQGDLKPDYIIPFKLDKKAAKEALKNHYKKKPFIPKSFVSENHIDKIQGMYVPFWVYDTATHGNVRYKATRVRTWRDSNYIYTETSFYSVVREGDVEFSKIPADASSKLADDLMDSLEPFDFAEAVDFQTAYMAGYLADRYDVTIEQNDERIRKRVKNSTESVLASTVQGYTTVVPEQSSVLATNGEVRYAMYPVWMLNTTWKGKQYTFAMNGQTGKMVGDIPVDMGRFWCKFTIVGLAVAAAVFGFLTLFNVL